MPARRWVTHKFGGSSLAEADCFRRVARSLLRQDPEVNPDPARGQDGYRQAVIVSAMSGMTDSLVRHLTVGAVDHQNGIFRAETDVVDRIGGQPPQTLDAFIREHRRLFSTERAVAS